MCSSDLTPLFTILRHRLGSLRSFTLYSYEQASVWGPDRYAKELERASREISIPVIPSINCSTDSGWRSYATRMVQAGAPAIELNISCPHSSITFSGGEVVANLLRVAELVRAEVKVPLAIKLSGQLTTPMEVVAELEKRGIDGVVIFNRFTGLDIDIEAERPIMHGAYAGHGGLWAISYPLRWISEISPSTGLSIAGSGGTSTSADVVKYILAGADAVQVCTAIYLAGYKVIAEMNEGLAAWMARKGYDRIEAFRGKVSGGRILTADQVLRKHHQAAEVDESSCSGCGTCAAVCIYFAPEIHEGKARITARCDGCGLCVHLCPRSAIRMRETRSSE